MPSSPRVAQLLAALDARPGSTLRELADLTGLPVRQLASAWRTSGAWSTRHRWYGAP